MFYKADWNDDGTCDGYTCIKGNSYIAITKGCTIISAWGKFM